MDNKKISYKLLSIDLDGTLLSPILKKSKKSDCLAIQDYMSKGGMTLINTGRPPWSAMRTIQRINCFGSKKVTLLSCFNGSYIKDFNDGETKITTISREYCQRIIDIAKRYRNVNIWLFTEQGAKTESFHASPANYLFYAGYHLSHMKKLSKCEDLTSFKIDILSARKSVIDKIYRDLITNNIDRLVNVTRSLPRLIEITASEINKGFAINYFANKYNIAKNEIVSLGDSFNDLTAFDNSGLSIGVNPKNKNFVPHCNRVIPRKANGVKAAIYDYIIKDVDTSNIQLIFSDLDGTLIDNKTKLFSYLTKLALQQCTNHLIPIAIASGRCIHDEIKIIESMELNPKTNIYIIGNNGATIYDLFTHKYISQSPIDDADARKIFDTLIRYAKKENDEIGFIVYQHSTDLLFYNEPFWKPINLNKTGFADKYDPWETGKPIYITKYPDDIICYKFVVKFPNPAKALVGLEELKKEFPNLEVCLSSTVNLEINKKGINKGFAAKKLLDIIKIDPDRTLVLGDGQNDIPALKLTKNSFVPAYAPDYVKKEATHIIENVDVTNFASTVVDRYVLRKGHGK